MLAMLAETCARRGVGRDSPRKGTGLEGLLQGHLSQGRVSIAPAPGAPKGQAQALSLGCVSAGDLPRKPRAPRPSHFGGVGGLRLRSRSGRTRWGVRRPVSCYPWWPSQSRLPVPAVGAHRLLVPKPRTLLPCWPPGHTPFGVTLAFDGSGKKLVLGLILGHLVPTPSLDDAIEPTVSARHPMPMSLSHPSP